MKPIFKSVLGKQVYVAHQSPIPAGFSCISMSHPDIEYHPLCDDWGPIGMLGVVRFIRMLEKQLSEGAQVVLVAEGLSKEGRRSLTNAVCLLGAYMIIMRDMTAKQVAESFSWLEEEFKGTRTEHFRDATFSVPDFGLTLLDVWAGLER